MTRILFVDDEPNVLSGLRRQLHSQRAVWDMRFVGSGELALAALDEQPVDFVVTDMRMPGMDGVELLRHVRERCPSAVRLVLSGHADRADLLRSIHHAHQYLAKPCDTNVLCTAVERAARLRRDVPDESMVALAAAVDSLPSLPALHDEIVAGLRQDPVCPGEVASLVEQDVGLSAKVVQVVSSAFFGAPRHVTSPAQAAVMLGHETLRALTGESGRGGGSSDGADVDLLREVWLRSQHVARLARTLASSLGLDHKAQDHAFLAGLMHLVGRLVLLGGSSPPPQCSPRTLAATGAFLLAIWGFPDEVVTAVAEQHQSASGGPPRVATTLQMALDLADKDPDGVHVTAASRDDACRRPLT